MLERTVAFFDSILQLYIYVCVQEKVGKFFTQVMNILLNDVANAALLFVNFHHQSLADILPRSPKLQRHQFYVLLMQYYLLRRLNSLLSLLSDYWEILSTLTFTSVTLTFTSIFSCSLNCFWLTLTLLFFFCLSFFPFNF